MIPGLSLVYKVGCVVLGAAALGLSVTLWFTQGSLERARDAEQKCEQTLTETAAAYLKLSEASGLQSELVERLREESALAEAEANELIRQARAAAKFYRSEADRIKAARDATKPEERTCERAVQIILEAGDEPPK